MAKARLKLANLISDYSASGFCKKNIMSSKADIFYGKVLLFGEYSILFNSKGLTIPYTHFTGQLSFINDDKYTDYEFRGSVEQAIERISGLYA